MIHKLLVVVLCTLVTNGLFSQCIVNLGSDSTYCETAEPKFLAENVTITGGTAPFTYAWSCIHESITGTIYTASDFLNDTTLLNPILEEMIEGELFFTLLVTDADNEICYDEITVSLYPFVNTLEVKTAYISSIDTTQIYSGIAGGTLPYTYFWSPDYEISDPTLQNPLVSPDENTSYSLILTDANGCTANDIFYVYVYPVSIQDVTQHQVLQVSPNPTSNNCIIKLPISSSGKYVVEITDATGSLVKRIQSADNKIAIPFSESDAGIYYLMYKDENNIRYSAQIMVAGQ